MTLTAAIGRYPHTEALFAAPAGLDLQHFPVISRAFAPMIRHAQFDLAEMALATLLMAREAGSDLMLLPVVLASRDQSGALLRRANDPFAPEGLRGRRIGVRAYSQTTGMWLRGVLQDDAGIAPADVQWVTFEDAHVPHTIDPAWCTRAAPGADMLAMLHAGALDAAIFGADTPADPGLVPVFPDLDAAARAFTRRHGFMPINHVAVLRRTLAGQAASLTERFAAAQAAAPTRLPSGREAMEPAIALAIRYCCAQGLLRRALTMEEVWA